ncbi:hypothetical protein RT97_17630 [Variovorax paradoxus]|uniref:Uncharacterized protein n=1 Tax=Variovorax paradoxus TaxID=34073 RepID=A0A0D0KWK9_VARPD|nr:hypothetical protein RT97_17630 [Variovorax paradoxus]
MRCIHQPEGLQHEKDTLRSRRLRALECGPRATGAPPRTGLRPPACGAASPQAQGLGAGAPRTWPPRAGPLRLALKR